MEAFHKRQAYSWPDDRLLACQEGFCLLNDLTVSSALFCLAREADLYLLPSVKLLIEVTYRFLLIEFISSSPTHSVKLPSIQNEMPHKIQNFK
jgi:hypothetical protein